MITGSIVAIVTPMHADGSLDLPGLRRLVDFHVQEGTDAIVIVGTTGESPTVNLQEHCELIRVAVDQAAGRIPVIAGTGANSTAEAIELTRFARQAGAECGAVGGAVLQQADPGRASIATSGPLPKRSTSR
jgi:4-hydroxy-tetrahydrodipicolinate synthase